MSRLQAGLRRLPISSPLRAPPTRRACPIPRASPPRHRPSFGLRTHQHLAGKQPSAEEKRPAPEGANPTAPAAVPKPAPADHPSAAEQRATDWKIVKQLIQHVWPKGDWKTRGIVVLGFGLLIGGKVRLRLHRSVCVAHHIPLPSSSTCKFPCSSKRSWIPSTSTSPSRRPSGRSRAPS